MKYTIFIFTLALLFNTSSVFAQQSQQNQNPPQAIPVNEQTLQPIQSTFNSQGFRPSASGAANSMSKCVGSAGVSGLVRSAISSFSGDQTRVPAQNPVLEGKDTGTIATSFISWDQLGWCLVNSLVESISAATVNWINSGFQGNPTFIDDPTTFFSNLADYQAGVFLNELSGGFLCRPIQNIVRVNIAQSYNRSISPFNQRAQCTFSGSVENMERFMSGGNFSWNNWLSFTQNPYNNPMGASIYSGIELDRRIAAELGVEKTLLDWGSGFFSSRDKETGKITSPGTVIESQINERLFSGQRRLEIADEFDEVVNALVNQLIKMAVSEMTQSGSRGGNAETSQLLNNSQTEGDETEVNEAESDGASTGGSTSDGGSGVSLSGGAGGGTGGSVAGGAAASVRSLFLSKCGVGGSLNPTTSWSGDVNSIDWNNPEAPISEHFIVRDAIKDANPNNIKPEYKRNILALAQELDKVYEEYPIRIESWFNPIRAGSGWDDSTTQQYLNETYRGLSVKVEFASSNRDLTAVDFVNFLRRNWSGGLFFIGSFSPSQENAPESSRDLLYTRTYEPYETGYVYSITNGARLLFFGNGRMYGGRSCYEELVPTI